MGITNIEYNNKIIESEGDLPINHFKTIIITFGKDHLNNS